MTDTPTAKELFLAAWSGKASISTYTEHSKGGLYFATELRPEFTEDCVKLWTQCVAVADGIRATMLPPPTPEETLNLEVWNIGLATRSINALERSGVKTVRDLLSKTDGDLLKLRDFGRFSLKDVKNALIRIGARPPG